MKNQEINMQAGEMLRRLDSTTYNHSVRVMMISAEVEEYLNLTDHKLMCAALFHDIGKAYVPFDILDKKERLTGLERELVDLHSYFGYCMLNSIKVEEDICRIVLYHHGFRPLTIRDLGHYDNNNVYEKAQMLHTIDAFEALTSDRPYHRGLPSKEALKILVREGKFEQRTLEYITEVSSKDEIGTSAIHRNGFENNPDFINQLIMDMSL